MTIEVQIPTIMRPLTQGRRTVNATGSDIAELIANLDQSHPGIQERLIRESALVRFMNVYINDEDIRFKGGLSAKTADGDVVTILPAVAGGQPASRNWRWPNKQE